MGMKQTSNIILLCLLILLGACRKSSEPNTFLLHVEAYDMATQKPIRTKIEYTISKGNLSICRYQEKGLNWEVRNVDRKELELFVTSDGYEKVHLKISPGEMTKKIYLKKNKRS